MKFQPKSSDGRDRQCAATARKGPTWRGNANQCATGLIDIRLSGAGVRWRVVATPEIIRPLGAA